MESKLRVVFEISEFYYKLNEQDLMSLQNFISNFIIGSNGITEFYFIFTLKNKNEQLDLNKEELKLKITNALKNKNFSIKKVPLFFGFIINPLNLDDDNNKLLFYDFFKASENVIELLNTEVILFYSTIDLCDYLHINNFFSYFLNFDSNNTEREIKKISKDSNGIIDKSNQNDISFSSINYEFLTFLEEEEN